LGNAFVAGRNRVPSPPTGKIAFFTFIFRLSLSIVFLTFKRLTLCRGDCLYLHEGT
jgi:hypothetical protein